ncbi:plastocyanin/azurin family copper-binding protein [Methanoculleus sp.]|uniref:plastocyanin/azurin family copper-binding protein n=1 Tax=Methanoculleus sp. TaxID=90427 RepID=UPI0025F0B7CB|nr:plastocyanin/azurin family copper-binding protein [Methanoculleus sp.]
MTVEIAAENVAFDTETITVPAGAEVTVNFENRDGGVPHNVAVYRDSSRPKRSSSARSSPVRRR